MLKGKIAIVTGAAAGMGVAQVRALAEAGAAVVAVDIDPDETAAGVVFLASEASSSSTGHDLVADGGYLRLWPAGGDIGDGDGSPTISRSAKNLRMNFWHPHPRHRWRSADAATSP